MLTVEGATKSFGGLTAVNDVSFELGDKGTSGLVGPNGSGKTTLFHLITGFYRLDEGCVYFRDEQISGRAPYEISQMGLVRTFQQTRVLPHMSTLDTLLSAAPMQSGERLSSIFLRPGLVRREEEENREQAEKILELIKLAPLRRQPASKLSFGQQKLLELGRVLMAKPKMILLDEPTAGINPTLTRQLADLIRKLRTQGIQIFLIEHNMPLVADVCQQVFVMDSGSMIFSGRPSEARRDQKVIEAYLGRLGSAA